VEIGDSQVATSTTLPPKRIALDIEGKTYRFKRLTEEEWLQRRVGGVPPPSTAAVSTTGTSQHPVESALLTTTKADAYVSAPSQSKSPEPSREVVAVANIIGSSTTLVSSPSPSVAKPPSAPTESHTGPRPLPSMEVSAKAMPGFEPGDKPADVIKRRNVEQRMKEGRNMRRALRVDTIQTYRLLAGGSNSGTAAAKSAEKRSRGDEGDATVQKTLIGRGVVVTASFANLDKNGAPIVDDNKSDKKAPKRRPVPAVQGRGAAASASPSPASAVTAFSAPVSTTIKPNPLRDQIEADLNDYYMTVLAADRRSKLSGRGALTDYQLDKLLMDMAIRKKEEVTASLIQGQMKHVHDIQRSVYPPPTVPPSDPPKETGTAFEANAELAEQYGFGAGRDQGSNYYYALDDGDDTDYDEDEVFQSSEDEVSDVLQGRFRGKSRYCYQLYTDNDKAQRAEEDDGQEDDNSGGDDAPEGDVDDDFGFTELSVEPHRQHMAEQWNSQPADVAQWNSNYDTHFEARDKRVAHTQGVTRQRKASRAAPLSTIKSYLESAAGGRGGGGAAETYFADEEDNYSGEPEFVLDDVPAYMSSTSAVGPVGKALGIIKSNVGGEDPEVLYADDDEYDSNAEEHYQGEYPDESPPSSTDSDDDDEGIASTDEWDFDGDGAHQHNAAVANRRQTRRKKKEAEDDDDSDDEEAEQRYCDPQSLGAEDGANGMDGFLDDDEEVAPRRFAPGGGAAEDEDDFDVEPTAEGILRKKVVYYELPASDDDEY
jgi:hypothetical protein